MTAEKLQKGRVLLSEIESLNQILESFRDGSIIACSKVRKEILSDFTNTEIYLQLRPIFDQFKKELLSEISVLINEKEKEFKEL